MITGAVSPAGSREPRPCALVPPPEGAIHAADLGTHQLDQRRKVVCCAQELGIAFERTDAGGRFGIVQTPAYLAINPNALVPMIECDDAAAAAAAPALGVERDRALPLRAPRPRAPSIPSRCPHASTPSAGWTGSRPRSIQPAARPSCNGCARPPSAATQLPRSARCWRPSALLALLDAHLAAHDFLCGDRFTMADIPIGCELHRWFGLPSELYRGQRGRTSNATSRPCASGPRRAVCSTCAGVKRRSPFACT